MRLKTTTAIIGAALVLLGATDAGAAPKKGDTLKTTNVTLYDCGLAQLEKQVTVNGARRLRIDVTLAHLDDLLASLVVATDGGVKVKGVNYPSVRNLGQAIEASGMANALSEDGTALTMPADVPGYLEALVGMTVKVERNGGKNLAGTVLACVNEKETGASITTGSGAGESTVERPPRRTLVVVDQAGSISWIPVEDISKVTPRSKREAAALGDFATQLGKSNGFAETAVELETTRGSRGRLAASFIRQIPLWRTVYKVSAEKDGVTMEAWAVVHNDTTEDWEDVEMTLVSGLPQSFVMSVASPRYEHRETRILQGEGSLMPQLGARTADSLLYDFDGLVIGESFGYGGLGMYGIGRGGGGSSVGYGSAGRGGVVAGSSEQSSSLLEVGEPAAEEQAEAKVEGEISTYRAMNAVSVPARTSSLVPLIRRKLEGGAFTLVENGSSPATCVRAKNDTGLVLQSGVSSFYIRGRFRGQAELYRTEPGDIGVWCFGEDPDVVFDRKVDIDQKNEALEWRGGRLWTHNIKRTTYEYRIENMAGQERRVAIDVRHIANGRIVSPKEVLDTDLDNRKLRIVQVPGREEKVETIVIEEGVMTPVGTDLKNLEEMSRWKDLPGGQRGVLDSAVNMLRGKKKLEKALAAQQKRVAREEARAATLKQTLEAVPDTRGRARMVEDILEELMETQERIVERHDEIDTLNTRISLAQSAVSRLLEGLAPSK